MPVNSSRKIQIVLKSLLLPAKCSSACALILASSARNHLGNSVNVDRHDVNQREHKHPDQINKVPIEAADLNVFVFQFLDPRRYDAKVEGTGQNVEHVQPGDGKKR